MMFRESLRASTDEGARRQIRNCWCPLRQISGRTAKSLREGTSQDVWTKPQGMSPKRPLFWECTGSLCSTNFVNWGWGDVMFPLMGKCRNEATVVALLLL